MPELHLIVETGKKDSFVLSDARVVDYPITQLVGMSPYECVCGDASRQKTIISACVR